jgi:alginate O-acetyltransferase complex protein AlgJ
MKLLLISKTLLISAFLLVIFAPPIKMALSPLSAWSFEEKRKLAARPQLRFTYRDLDDFPKRYETFYNDHFGFRQWLVERYYRYKQKYFGGIAITPYVLSGTDGWYYYTGDRLMEDFLGQDTLTEKELEIVRSNLERKRQWLADHGAKYLFVVAPDKQSIYPEHMPDDIRNYRRRSRLDQLADYLKHHSDVAFLDLRGPLLAAKKRGQVYYRTDAHWNIHGAFAAYQAIMAQVRRWFPELPLPVVQSVDHAKVLVPKGDIATIIQLDDQQSEAILVPDMAGGCARQKRFLLPDTDPPCPVNLSTCGPAALRVVMFTDSFDFALNPLFAESFHQLASVRRPYDHRIMLQLMDQVRPQLVIEEIAERYLVRVKESENAITADPLSITKR